MLVSYNWLSQYVDLNHISAEELADKITKAGIEVEVIHDLNKGATGVVVGHVESCGKHPNADKLNLCEVNIGEADHVQIVCGARNVAEGQKVPVAKAGAVLPGNFKIKKSKLRGEVSNGMICSLQELGIEGKLVPREMADGIFVMPEAAEAGSDALEYLNMNDRVLEFDLTPNRADCLNMLGAAYEVAAIFGQDVHLPQQTVAETSEKASDYISVKVENEADNPYYGVRVIKGVNIAPSPQWLQNRLIAAGIRPISNIVDITNFVLLEYGQPLHAFDYDRLGSKQIFVRRAKDEEKILTLDDEERTLSGDHLVITNGTDPVAVAGVMGGASSEVQDDTVNVLLEAAYFDPALVRKGSTDLGVRSESSQRFEKGVDPNRVVKAADRAASMMAEMAGGEVLQGIVEQGQRVVEPKAITITAEKINAVLGTDISQESINEIFARLGFETELKNDEFTVTVPTRRMDIAIQEDLIEEVGRLYGYDHLPTTLPVGNAAPGLLSEYQEKRRRVRRYLEGAGLHEAITYSLTTPEKSRQYMAEGRDLNPVQLAMPMSEDRSTLRMSLTPQLLEAVRYNLNRQISHVALYEVGPVFLTEEETLTKLPEEKEKLAAVITGVWHSHPWQKEKKSVDFFTVKGVLQGLFKQIGLEARVSYKQTKSDGLHPGRTASVLLDSEKIGFIGQIHPTQQQALDLNETYVFEIDLEKVLHLEVEPLAYKTLPRFPSVSRDIALVVDENITASDLQGTIEKAGGKLLKEVTLFDLYQGEHLDEGKKSLAFSLRYYDPERTLTDEEVVKAHDRVLSALKDEHGAELRK